MSNKEILRKIGVIISELSDQHSYLSANPGSLNEFELELLKANVKFLTDHVEIFQRITHAAAAQPAEQPAEETPEPTEWSFKSQENPVKEEPERAGPPAAAVEEEVQPEEPAVEDVAGPASGAEPVAGPGLAAPAKPEEPDEAPVKPEAPAPVEEKQTEPEAVVNEVVIRERTIAVDVPAENKKAAPTLNDLLSASRSAAGGTVSSQFNKPVLDLKSSISLNDKLLFVRELFNGYSLAYTEALDLLNRFDNYDSAANFLQVNYAVKNKWDSKPVVSEQFYNLLKRRYGQA